IAEKCTNTSSPASCSMKPKPFSPLNHFTVPSFIEKTSLCLCTCYFCSFKHLKEFFQIMKRNYLNFALKTTLLIYHGLTNKPTYIRNIFNFNTPSYLYLCPFSTGKQNGHFLRLTERQFLIRDSWRSYMKYLIHFLYFAPC